MHTVFVSVADLAGNTANATWSFTVDITPPSITDLTPPDGANVTTPVPTISAVVADELSGVNPESIVMKLDGVEVEHTYDPSTGKVSYTPSEPLAEGEHTVFLSASDKAGNTAEQTWSFTIVRAARPPVAEIRLSASSKFIPADGETAVKVDALVLDEFGMPIPGVVVNFTTTAGALSAGSAVSNETGFATVFLTSAQRVTTAVITALADNASASTNVYFVDPEHVGFVLSYDVELVSGWNLISLPLIPLNSTITELLRDVAEGIERVWAYDASTGEWYYYDLKAGVGDLKEMKDGLGYWVKTSEGMILTVFGFEQPPPPATPRAYSLAAGWNLIGFKETEPMTVSEYLRGVPYIRVIAFDPGTGRYVILGDNDLLIPGYGYWVALSEPGTIFP